MCVGVLHDGPKTRWALRWGAKCDQHGFAHSFSFPTMSTTFTTPLVRACIAATTGAQTPIGGKTVRRLVAFDECPRKDSKLWKLEKELVLLAKPSSEKDHRICSAEGTYEAGTDKPTSPKEGMSGGAKVWRVFRDSACKKRKVMTHQSEQGVRIHWNVAANSLYVPPDGNGNRLCLCKVGTPTEPPFYTWVESDCPSHGETYVNELCFHTLTDLDILRFSYLMDEVT